MRRRAPEYKPLLFTTTVRNPKRIKALLNILKSYNGEILTDELAKKIMGELMRYGLYRPVNASKSIINKWGLKRISNSSEIGKQLLTDEEVEELIEENPQNHKEAGFEKGWSSRFATEFDFAKELGFVYYLINEKIEFSEIGLKLPESIEIRKIDDEILFSENNPEFEQQAFLHALTKYQRNNPFVRVANENVPLILLLEVIKKLDSDTEFNKIGISKLELPLVIFWKNNDADALYREIKSIRKEYRFEPSWEIIVDICINKIMEGKFKKFKAKSIMVDYPDEFIRKMRLTGLISIRGGGRFIDINGNEIEKVNYILENYSKYQKFKTEKEYFNYMSKTDEKLISIVPKKASVEETNKQLEKWVETYSWEQIKNELYILSKKVLSKDEVLKYLSSPVRLEFLVALAIKSKFKDIKVIPNYPCDDEGIPTSNAGGDKGDIECYEDSRGVLIEVTMSEGRNQTVMEVWPIERHLEEFKVKINDSMCYFVAPTIFIDSKRQIDWVKDTNKLIILPKTINEFVNIIEQQEMLYATNL
jgi:hypothetical protein